MYIIAAILFATLPEVWLDSTTHDYTLVYDEAVFSNVTDKILRIHYNDNTLTGYDDEDVTFGIQLESRYYDSVTDVTASEMVFAWTDNDTYSTRALQLNWMHESGLASLRSQGQFELRNTAGTEAWRITEDLQLRAISGRLVHPVSNTKWIYQEDFSDTERSLIYRNDRKVILGESGDQVSVPGDLAIGFQTDASAMLHLQASATKSATYIPVRIQPTITTDSDVYGLWHYLTVNVEDGEYPSSLQSIWVDPPNINLGSNSQVWTSTTLHVAGAATEAYHNYALRVSGSTALSKVDGTLEIGTLRLSDPVSCTHFEPSGDKCFVVEDSNGYEYEIPAYKLP